MLIGIDASRANREHKTGVEWYSYHLIQELKNVPQQNGDTFILYTSDKLRGDLKHLPDAWESRQLSWPPKYLWTQIRLCWEMFIHPVDLLFVPAHTLPFFCFARPVKCRKAAISPKAKLFNRVKSVVTVHDLGFERFKKQYSLWSRFYYPIAHRLSVKKAETIIVPSGFTKKEIIKLYKVKPDKIRVVPLGYDKENYYLIEDKNDHRIRTTLEKYGIKKPFFLYVGRLEKKKNVSGLLRAYKQLTIDNKQLTPPDLVLVGGSGYGYKEIKSQMFHPPKFFKKKLAAGKNIKCINEIGYVESDELTCLYNAAQAFVFPSFYEGFGIPVLEAMACGCPVLASRAGSLPEVGGQAALYFNPKDIADIVRVMKKITADKDLRMELRKKGLERVKNFSWYKCARETMELLSSIE